jgi:1-piperideine-2-carboxylate/1-pyrroline-2-carboxylate reductase [NAD(P)H]
LLTAQLDTHALPTLADVLLRTPTGQAALAGTGPVLFKSCGAALWDLAAARCAAGL